MENRLTQKVINATKWSMFTELIAKLVTPITNMILARILVPEAFGVVATISMIVSFADMFTDSGFQKYLVQHEFDNECEKNRYANVAFWTNFFISIVLWALISIYAEEISILVGLKNIYLEIKIACIALPLTSFSSIQMALYRRDFDFKTLFTVRLAGILVPFIVTIPVSIIYRNHWGLIIGIICGNIINSLILTIKSRWKPSLYFNFKELKIMFSFSLWSLLEAILIWFTVWIDIFIVGNILSEYYLGLYQTGINSVNGILSIITSTTTGIIFSTLSRLQNDDIKYKYTFLKFQKVISLIVIPMGVGIFIYRDFITSILLGENWSEASIIIGLWGVSSSIVIVVGQYCSEVYRSRGLPKISVLVQVLHLLALVPTCYFSASKSFDLFIWCRTIVRFQIVLIHFIFIYNIIKVSPKEMFDNIKISLVGSILMALLSILLGYLGQGVLWNIISILLCSVCYIAIVWSNIDNDIKLKFKEQIIKISYRTTV